MAKLYPGHNTHTMKDTTRQLAERSSHISNDFGDWLTNDFDFSHWGTVTTPYRMTRKSARRIMDGYWRSARKLTFTRMFWAVETHKHGGCHIHFMVGWDKGGMVLTPARFKALEPAIWKQLITEARRMTGEESRIHVTKVRGDRETAQHYVAKYCGMKFGCVDWDMYIDV